MNLKRICTGPLRSDPTTLTWPVVAALARPRSRQNAVIPSDCQVPKLWWQEWIRHNRRNNMPQLYNVIYTHESNCINMFAEWRIHRIHHYDISWPHGHLCLVKRILPVWKHRSSPNISQALCTSFMQSPRIVTGIKPSLACQVHIPGQVPLFNQAVVFKAEFMDGLAFLFAKCSLYNQTGHMSEGMWQADRNVTLMKTCATIGATYTMHTWCACTHVLYLTCSLRLSSSMCSMPSAEFSLQLDQLRSMGFGCCTPLERTGLGALIFFATDVSTLAQSAWARRMSECPRIAEVNKAEWGSALLDALGNV